MEFLYVTNRELKDELLSKHQKMINSFNNSGKETWIFEYDPSLFSIPNGSYSSQECFVSNELLMFF